MPRMGYHSEDCLPGVALHIETNAETLATWAQELFSPRRSHRTEMSAGRGITVTTYEIWSEGVLSLPMTQLSISSDQTMCIRVCVCARSSMHACMCACSLV